MITWAVWKTTRLNSNLNPSTQELPAYVGNSFFIDGDSPNSSIKPPLARLLTLVKEIPYEPIRASNKQ